MKTNLGWVYTDVKANVPLNATASCVLAVVLWQLCYFFTLRYFILGGIKQPITNTFIIIIFELIGIQDSNISVHIVVTKHTRRDTWSLPTDQNEVLSWNGWCLDGKMVNRRVTCTYGWRYETCVSHATFVYTFCTQRNRDHCADRVTPLLHLCYTCEWHLARILSDAQTSTLERSWNSVNSTSHSSSRHHFLYTVGMYVGDKIVAKQRSHNITDRPMWIMGLQDYHSSAWHWGVVFRSLYSH